ncbi:phosphotransferase [Aliiglaciecola sp. NS0011-25]|uniref:aminoglycoside phosphotransferase family protein n=1 Tax=Aliiglaciecola sp. NS0011-25 TaxID=3127654 RepID=UPI003106E96F
MTQIVQTKKALLQWINSSTEFRCQKIEMIFGDASFRRYFRFWDELSHTSIIAVDAPPEYEDSSKFVNLANAYFQHHVIVPKVLAHNPELGFYCLQDFGDEQFSQALNPDTMQVLYTNALNQIPAIQSCVVANGQSLPFYDDELLRKEKYIFTHWLIEVHLNIKLTKSQMDSVDKSYEFLHQAFKSQPQAGVHRDFHSRNLMLLANGDIGVIDFQDAVIGPITYDAVSLLRDCYQKWPPDQVELLLRHFHQQFYSQYQWQDFTYWFDLTGIQRHLKASGIFCRLFHRDGKDGYLSHIPRTLDYILEVGANYPALADLVGLIENTIKPKLLELTK